MIDKSMRVVVFGAGTMGSGIAQVVATAGFSVVVVDSTTSCVGRSKSSITDSLERLVKKNGISAADKETILSRIIWVGSDGDLPSSPLLIIEAISENVALKEELVRDLSKRYPGILLASNTSSISLSRLARASVTPESVIGLHFFNPVPLMKLVEVIRALQTSDEIFETAISFVKDLGKTPVCVANRPGFAVNRILMMMLNEAFFAYSEGVASAEDIDAAMKLGCNHPIGPLALADMIGLDICLSVCEQLYEQFGDPKYRPCYLLREMVDAGFLGRKSGKGFHNYQV